MRHAQAKQSEPEVTVRQDRLHPRLAARHPHPDPDRHLPAARLYLVAGQQPPDCDQVLPVVRRIDVFDTDPSAG